jgi:nucleotide-binding universal stress UspA family protein
MTFSHMLVAIDGSELSGQAVVRAIDLARTLGARITFFHADPGLPGVLAGFGEQLDPSTVELLVNASHRQGSKILDEALAKAAAVGVAAAIETGINPLPHEAILAAAQRCSADLIVMASHGRRGLSALLLGSETQKVLTRSPVPVLVVR